ncbi:uncharacterized protein LOC102654964 isoform X2 [Apis mellifera]|uniref:Uncharacterized protein LOC102654964 isoform X2 n=1 Tax=Apis mellifera TaxID=7460 RepID=A0A7M7GLD2_APIME|nr:uncharacterized protein LOC102654964 isoform X2 [Apis mellifera]|eukprot:XP_006558589.1 uncharacterized protein LOC102654964 isoform X2 [Apis mellifera]
MSECSSERLPRRNVGQEEWINRHFRKLACLYRKSPCLWKKDTWSYLNSEHRHRAYARIHVAMNLPRVTFVEIVLKIREMRRLYVNELRNLLEARSNGYYYQVQIPWFYELHRFLYPYLDYDEAVELHKIDKSCGECRESEEFSSRCNCTRCTLSRRSSRVKSASTSASPRGFSISSPAISLPKIKSQPRTCSRSCGRISNAKKQVERSLSCRTNSCCKRLKRREDSSGDDEAMNRRQENQEFRILGKYSTASSSYTYESESDQWDIFSTTVTRFLKRLERPYALEAQAEIQRILKAMLIKSKNGRSTNPRQLRREERFSGGKYGWQAGSKMGGQVTWLARCYFIRGKEDRRISR